MSTANWIISLAIGIIFAFVCYRVAANKGRGPVLWAILGFFFSLIALIILLIIPRKTAAAV